MARLIRFIVHQVVDGKPRTVGLFGAAYDLRRSAELPPSEHDRLDRLLKWFVAELKIPPSGSIPEGAIFWYHDVGRFAGPMWEMVHLLREHGAVVELITGSFVGQIVYRDDDQLAAIPPPRWKQR